MLRGALDARLLKLHTHLIARVTSYNPANQSCSAQPEVMEPDYAEDGTYTPRQLPVFADVPVAWPRFGGFRIVGPLAVGDRVVLLMHETSLQRWKHAGGGNTDPADPRRFHLSDAIALPGVADYAHALTNAPTATMSVGADAGPTIEIGSLVQLGGAAATDYVLKGTSFALALSTWAAAVDTFAAAVPGASAPAGTLATATGVFLTAVTAALSAVVQVL